MSLQMQVQEIKSLTAGHNVDLFYFISFLVCSHYLENISFCNPALIGKTLHI